MLIPIEDSSQVFQARQNAVQLARSLDFDEHRTGKVAIVATELATNLLKHAGSGRLSASRAEERGPPCVEILAIDKGPGIGDVQQSMTDGYSTAGTAGTGLGAVRRLSDRFEIYSRFGQGTVLMARLAGQALPRHRPGLEVGAAVAAFPGETVCGDAWAFLDRRDGALLLVADGLGHGPDAATAAQEAVAVLLRAGTASAAAVAEAIHRVLGKTRGAAIGIAEINSAAGHVKFVGIGNISGCLIADGAHRSMVSHNGTAGLTARRIAEFLYPFSSPPIVVLHSDGVSAKWDLDRYPGLASQHPSVIAGVIYRDFNRGRDDAAVAVAKHVA